MLLFASCRELFGASALDLELEAGATVRDLERALADREPRFGRWEGRIKFGLGDEIVTGERTLADGDAVAVLPPVSGG